MMIGMLLGSFCVIALSQVASGSLSFCDADGWQRVFADEFDTLDENTWKKDVRGPGDSRTRAANATADSVWVSEGSLVIRSNATWNGTAWTDLTSGAVQSQGLKAWRGRTRVCVNAKLPGGPPGNGSGIWPAHWMMPDDSSCWPCHGEIDIMEALDGNSILHGTYHYCLNETCGETPQHKQLSGTTPLPERWWDTWHEYAVEYGGGAEVAFAIDGAVYEIATADAGALFWDTPFYLILNSAIGDGTTWAKATDAATIFPTYHVIDYVHVSQPDASASTAIVVEEVAAAVRPVAAEDEL